jgi:hypothetical protein
MEIALTTRLINRFWSHVDKNGPIIRPELGNCWVWTASISSGDGGGYGRFSINGNEIKAHIASWLINGLELPDGALVCHECDNRSCVRPYHLILGDCNTNMIDMYNRGRDVHYGEHNGHAKLTELQALEIINSSMDNWLLGKKYGVDIRTITRIKRGILWGYLQAQE